MVLSERLQPAQCMLTSPKGSNHTTCVQVQKLLHRVYCVNFRCCKVGCSGKCCECRLADHLLMAQRMQQPDEQDSSQPSAPVDSSQAEDASAQAPAVNMAIRLEPQPDGQDGAGQPLAAKQPEEAVRTLAKVFSHVHQPATAAKKANPKLGPLDRRKRKLEASHADILAGASNEQYDARTPCQDIPHPVSTCITSSIVSTTRRTDFVTFFLCLQTPGERIATLARSCLWLWNCLATMCCHGSPSSPALECFCS